MIFWFARMVESGDRMSSSGVDDHGKDGEQARPSPDQFIPTSSRYCPSRWLMAHHDTKANIYTLSSHMCLADLNNEDESLLALIDFKRCSGQQQSARLDSFGLARLPVPKAPYDCRLRVYRGQKLIYNHFLDDIPSCLFATTIKAPARASSPLNVLKESHQNQTTSGQSLPEERTLLTLAINDDVYFYHKLKASHKMSLEDNEIITNSLNRSEFEAWQMVRQNKVDVETLRELLFSLSNELGSHQLTSHSNSFLALETNEDRKNYLLYWKLKKLSDGFGEHIMSMDSICCAAARLRSNSSVTRSGDFGQTREHGAHLVNSSRWNKVMDFQKSGLIVGTEDRHLLIFELLSTRAILEAHHRLPSVPDHLLVERKSPSSIDSETDLKNLTYKILVSCRDCCIYCIDQTYLLSSATNKPVNNKGRSNLSPGANKVRKLLTLKCNVLDMCFTGDEPAIFEGISAPSFIVTCLDRRVYCFSSLDGHCKWMVELDMPATCLISLPIARLGGGGGGGVSNESNLIGVASQANRIDFYTSHNGLIVDTIYLGSDNCQAMTFGRFGREDNCLCLVTSAGHLLIFILKRTARFANAQCLSSAAAHAADVLAACSHLPASVTRPLVGPTGQVSSSSLSTVSTSNNKRMNLNKPASLPSAFSISKANSASVTDRGLDKLQSEHNCDEVIAKSTIDAHLEAPQLQVPIKGRDFVDHIVEQSRNSTGKQQFAKEQTKFNCYFTFRGALQSTCSRSLLWNSIHFKR